MAKQLSFGAQVRKVFEFDPNIFVDQVKVRKDGTVVIRKTYFYRHGKTSHIWADEVLRVLPFAELVEHSDHFKQWPKESYFEVIVRAKVAELRNT